MEPRLQNVIALPLAENAVKRLRERGRLPKVVLYLKGPVGINLAVTEGDLDLQIIGNRVYMDDETFDALFEMSKSKAKTRQGKRAAVSRIISKALKIMLEEALAIEKLEEENGKSDDV